MSRDRTALKRKVESLRSDLYALYLASRDPRVPLKAKALIVIAVGYFLSPFDLIPDFIPILGYADDLVIVPALASAAVKMIPREVMDECRSKAQSELRSGHAKWAVAALVILIWLAMLLILAEILLPPLL